MINVKLHCTSRPTGGPLDHIGLTVPDSLPALEVLLAAKLETKKSLNDRVTSDFPFWASRWSALLHTEPVSYQCPWRDGAGETDRGPRAALRLYLVL